MRLLMIRHAVTAETGSKLTGRLPGVPLSPAGEEMARAAAERLAHLAVDHLVSSPILRCRQTAKAFGAVWNLEPQIDAGITEADFGTWSGRSLKDLNRLKTWRNLHVAPSRFRFPEGETLFEVQARSVATVERLAAAHPKQTVAIVSHNDVIRCLLCHHLGMPLDLIQRLDVGPASLSVVDFPASGPPRVPMVNTNDPRLRR